MLLKNGFNESIGRVTPRCLRNENPVAAASVFGQTNNNIGAFHGTSNMNNVGDTKASHMTDTKSIMATVEELRRGKQLNCQSTSLSVRVSISLSVY